MAVFSFACIDCGLEFDRRGAYSDVTPFCGACGGSTRQLISAPALVFKGTGWYVTDYRGKENNASK